MTRKGGAVPAGEEECVRPWSGDFGEPAPQIQIWGPAP